MKSLINTRAKFARAISALSLIAAIAAGTFAQRVQPENKMYGDPGFRGEVIDLNVVNADIREILNYVTDQYGVNFVLDKSVKETPVTVKVKDVPWNVALDSILQAQALGIQVNGNILRVAASEVLATEGALLRERQNNQIDTSPLQTELIRLNYATAAGDLATGTPQSGTSTDKNGDTDLGKGAGGDGLLPIIKRRLSRRGSIEIDSRSNSLIITDVPVNLAAVKQLIAILDQPEPQVEIEARIVIASRTFSREIGAQLFGLINGANNSGAQLGNFPQTITKTAIPDPPTRINNTVVDPSLPTTMGNAAKTVIGLTTGIFGTAQLSALISLGEQRGEVKVIATPRVTALNNRPAEIKNSTQIPITTVQPGSGVGPNGSALVATTTYVDVPLRLAITPQITDLGTVILNVVAENSSTAVVAGGAPPAINTQSMATQVTVPDGGTTVVGGVLFDDERETQDRTPGLSSIPILRHLFTKKGLERNTNEILFFITPRITRPDYNAQPQNGVMPRGGAIVQPVPMGNPSSNSTKSPSTAGTVTSVPGVVVPEGAVPVKPKE